MNQYLLLLGPALGFVFGAFFTWFLIYSRMRQIEKNAAVEKKELQDQLNMHIEQVKNGEKEMVRLKSRLEDVETSSSLSKKQLEEALNTGKSELEKRLTLEERVKKIEILEKVVSDLKQFENEAVSLREKNQNYESAMQEKKEAQAKQAEEIHALKKEILEAKRKNEETTDRLKDLAVLRERARKLEEENCNLLKENEQLRNIETQLRQINEIKELYARTVEENQSFRNQDLARHFLQIKQGLQQSVKAYNRMLHLVNNPILDDDRIIEIDTDLPEMSEEQMLDHLDADHGQLENFDGAKNE